MNDRIFPLIALVALCAPDSAIADPQSECGVDATSQIDIGVCLSVAETVADATVSSALDFAMQTAQELDEVTQRKVSAPALKAGQDKWLAYRDQHCEFVGTTFGSGSGIGIAIQSCRVALARARADVLMRYAQ